MANIFDTSKYILDTVGGEVSAMKLQKLCYYSQAWNLVWEGKQLFQEDFLRWDNGPVCRELFDLHQGLFYVDTHLVEAAQLSPKGLTGKESVNIDQVLEDYGKYTGGQLSELTHQEAPWRDTPKNEIISKGLIKDYYSSLSR
jgi:uncharacterized phage-associated protein